MVRIARIACPAAYAVLIGCAAAPQLRSAAAPTAPVSPFDAQPVSFLVPTPHFDNGESALVWVCVAADGSIASTRLLESSGDRRFDVLALDWARQVRRRAAPAAPAIGSCGSVRVEVRTPEVPRTLSGSDSALG